MEKILALHSISVKSCNICDLCDEQIINPDDFFALGYLTFNEKDPLYKFNFLKLHNNCISKLKDIQNLLALLKDFRLNGEWNGEGINYLIKTIEEHI